MSRSTNLLDRLKGGLIVSVQPVVGGPMDRDDIVTAMAGAAIEGGAVGLRIESAGRVASVRSALPDVPIVGIVKRDLHISDVHITPLPQDVRDLADAGADIIGIDGTLRPRPYPFADLAGLAHDAQRLVMADISSADEAMAALQCGVAIVGTTLSGYTGEEIPEEPDFDLLKALRRHDCFVVAEGRFNTPELCRQAILSGADCVTVGSALTRLELATAWFAAALSATAENER